MSETDSPYLFVYWYIDGIQQSISGGPSTSAYFSPDPSDFPGSSDGTPYTIEAVAYQYDPETNLMLSDSDSYSVTVYAPCRETAASLTASVTSCSWNGQTASAEATATVQHTGGDDAPDVEYTFTFGFKVSRIQKNGAAIGDVYAPLPQIKQGRVEPGDAKITKSFSDTYTLGNGWDPGDTFLVYARVTAWGRNAEINGKSEQCVDDDSAPFTIPRK